METAKILPFRPERERQPARPTGELTLKQIEDTPHNPAKRIRLSCPKLPGFCVIITESNSRSYYVEARVRGGKQRRVRLGAVDQLAMPKARSMARDLISQAHSRDKDSGQGVDISRATNERAQLTVADAYDLYKAEKLKREKPWSAVTVGKYDRVIHKYLESWRGRELFSITKADVSSRLVALREQIGAAEARLTFSFFGGLWNFHAADCDPVPVSPTAVLEHKGQWPRIARRETMISEEDFPAWWHSLDTVHGVWALYFRTLVLLGCRRKELLRAEWAWYDERRHVLTLPASVTKPGREVALPIGPKLAAWLKAHRATQLPGVRFIFAAPSGERLVNPGNPMLKVRAQHKLKWTMHDLRRVYSSVAHGLRIPVKAVKLLLNHSTKGDVTLGYIQVEEKELRKYQGEIEAEILRRAKVR